MSTSHLVDVHSRNYAQLERMLRLLINYWWCIMQELSLLMHGLSKRLNLILVPAKLIGILCFKGKIPARVKSPMSETPANFAISPLESYLVTLNMLLMHTKQVLTREKIISADDRWSQVNNDTWQQYKLKWISLSQWLQQPREREKLSSSFQIFFLSVKSFYLFFLLSGWKRAFVLKFRV